MNRCLAESVIALIAHPCCERASELERFAPRQWRRSMHWLVTSGLALYLLENLRRVARLDVLPAATCEVLEEMWSASALRVQSLQETLLDLNRRFSAAKLSYVNWKGFAAVPDFCPDTRLRAFCDFDFLVHEHDLTKFHSILVEAGFTKVGELPDEVQYENLPGSPIAFDKAYHDRPWRKVELHTRLNAAVVGDLVMPDYTDLLERRFTKTVNGVPFPELSADDAFVLHALHLSRHFLEGWVRLSWLLELRNFIAAKRDDHCLWKEIRQRAELEAGTPVLLALAIWLAKCIFESDIPTQLNPLLGSVPARATAWLHWFGRSAALAEFPGTKLPFLLLRELLQTAHWSKFERSRLVPIKVPPTIARPIDTTLRQRAISAGWQFKYVWMRTRFHVLQGLRYIVEKRRWERAMGKEAAHQTLPAL